MNAAPSASGDAVSENGSARTKALSAALGFAVGIGLLGAAAWVIYERRGDMAGAWRSVRHAHPGLIALAAALPLLNWLLISTSFWLLMRRHGRIGLPEMSSAIGAAWLLNYLPLRAGMVGRVAYHKAVNRIGIRDSLRVMVENLAMGGVSVAALLAIAVALRGEASGWVWGAAVAAPLVVAVLLWGSTALRTARQDRGTGTYAAVLAVRYLDLLVWTGRYAVVFALVGAPVSLPGAVAFAAVSQAAMVVPFIGNGLGIREWAIGLTAAVLPAGIIGASGEMDTATGLMADLVNRGAEVVVAVPVGLASIFMLSRRVRRAGAEREIERAVEDA